MAADAGDQQIQEMDKGRAARSVASKDDIEPHNPAAALPPDSPQPQNPEKPNDSKATSLQLLQKAVKNVNENVVDKAPKLLNQLLQKSEDEKDLDKPEPPVDNDPPDEQKDPVKALPDSEQQKDSKILEHIQPDSKNV